MFEQSRGGELLRMQHVASSPPPPPPLGGGQPYSGWLRKKGESALPLWRTWSRVYATSDGALLSFAASPAAASRLLRAS